MSGIDSTTAASADRASDSGSAVKIPCPPIILEKVRQFGEHLETYKRGDYSEAQLRIDFLNPMLEALGWDVNNTQGFAEAYREVVYEDQVRVGGHRKAPDYGFYIGGRAAGATGARKFFLEAKKPSVDIRRDAAPAYQLRRYAWTAKLPLSILTDFEEFIVFDTRIKPLEKDKVSAAVILSLSFLEYSKRWHEIASVFSRDAVMRGSFDKYATAKRKKGAAPVDEAFLEEIEEWRDALAVNIAARNATITQRDLNFAVQRTIDRIIFLRMCEDRGIEQSGNLQQLLNGDKVYERMGTLFRRADERYNSGLFHFAPEKDRNESPDEFTLSLNIDDKALKDILKRLYNSPYEFSVMPPEILGQVYEQFLGKVITLTAAHKAKIEEKPEVRKAGGVYYTPSYIVDYIVKHTVGKLLGNSPSLKGGRGGVGVANGGAVASSDSVRSTHPLTPSLQGRGNGMTPKDAAKLRVLDPASGSGSFLIGAYQFLLDWHLRWYLQNDPDEHCKGKSPALLRLTRESAENSPSLEGGGGGVGGATSDKVAVSLATRTTHPLTPSLQGRGNASHDYRLTTAKRKEILLNSIYGVDIDSQAVEVTKLSLLLKVLEGESQDSITAQMRLFHKRALPDLGDNIKCGNSLIGPDFYDDPKNAALDDDQRARINVFDWKREFPVVFKSGGFDAVIGNPPWGAGYKESDLEYLRNRFARVVDRMVDSYIYFLDQAARLCNGSSVLGFIIPSTLLNQVEARSVRGLLLKRGVSALISLGQGVFGSKVLNTSTVLISATDTVEGVRIADLTAASHGDRVSAIDTIPLQDRSQWQRTVESDPDLTFFVGGLDKAGMLTRLRGELPLLRTFVEGSIQRGVSPDVAEAHVLTPAQVKSNGIEPEVLRKSISGPRIKRYGEAIADQYIIYTTRDTDIDQFPNAKKFLSQFRRKNTCKEVIRGNHPWWALHRPRDRAIFNSPKLIGLTTTREIAVVLDPSCSLCVTDAMYVLRAIPGVDLRLMVAILHSRMFSFLYRVANQGEARVIPQVKASKIEPLPFPRIDDLNGKAKHDRMVSLVDRMLDLHKRLAQAKSPADKERLPREIEATDQQIDALVYELYGMSDDEIKIVKEATKRHEP